MCGFYFSLSVMKSYFNNREATYNTLKNGWIRTGDIVYYDEEEFFFVIDRIKNLIKVDGCQVSPSEIENELQKHPLVEECCVIGKPDLEHGEVPLAFVRCFETIYKMTEYQHRTFHGLNIDNDEQLHNITESFERQIMVDRDVFERLMRALIIDT
ncbi:4-coumarate--CoA ligase-like 5 [Armadillidium vulgare]|nr:4-coumarate--CoA ligase-like 5 [Armadillidium vulgare]